MSSRDDGIVILGHRVSVKWRKLASAATIVAAVVLFFGIMQNLGRFLIESGFIDCRGFSLCLPTIVGISTTVTAVFVVLVAAAFTAEFVDVEKVGGDRDG